MMFIASPNWTCLLRRALARAFVLCTGTLLLGGAPGCGAPDPSGTENPIGTTVSALAVANVTCTSAVTGNYCCGDYTTGSGCTSGKTLLRCAGKNTAPTSAITCASGCRTMPAGKADYCNLGQAEIDKLMVAARAALNSKGGQCKPWVQNLVSSTLPGIAVPSTAGTQYEWLASDNAVRTAAWRGTDVAVRLDKSVPTRGTLSTNFSISDGDSYVVVLYAASTSVQASVINGRGTTATSALTAQSNGKVSATFSGSGSYSLQITNASAAAVPFTAVVLSSSRFSAATAAARRGDVLQMYGDFSSGGGSSSPHTALVQVDGNASGNNWIDSNWCAKTLNCEIVSEHAVPLEKMIGYMARSSEFGFTVYRLQ